MEIQSEKLDHENKEKNYRNKFKKKSKNKRFLSNAKGFGKRGIYGRGTVISDDNYKYFINILDSMKLGFESRLEKCSFANSVFDQTVDNEINFASNQIVCKALESLIGYTSEQHFLNFMKAFSTTLRPICSDSFASHVLQKMIEIAFLRAVAFKNCENLVVKEDLDEQIVKKSKIDDFDDKLYNSEEKFSDGHRKECSDFVLRIGKFLLNNLEDFIWDVYASHLMRTSVLCLSGIHITKVAFDKNKDLLKDVSYYEVSSEWFETAKQFPQRIELWPQLADLPYSDLTSAFLSAICLSLKHIDKKLLKHFGKELLVKSLLRNNKEDEKIEENKNIEINVDINDISKNNQDVSLPNVFHATSSVRLLETLLVLSGPKLFTQLYAMLFPGKLAILSLNRMTNFAVQKLIENVKEKSDFELIFDELYNHFEELLKTGHTGVIFALSGSCFRLQTKQGAFIKAIQIALHTDSSKEKSEQILKCLLKLKPYEVVLEDKSQFVHLHGSLIIQNILQFNKPIFLVNCILNCTAVELMTIFNTPNGSFIPLAFMESKFIGEKSREKFIRHMEGTYIDLATTKFGSRVIENFFEYSNEAQRIRIVKQLSEKINQLNGTSFGRLISKKFRTETYKLSPDEWKSSFNRKNKAEKLFKDIIKK